MKLLIKGGEGGEGDKAGGERDVTVAKHLSCFSPTKRWPEATKRKILEIKLESMRGYSKRYQRKEHCTIVSARVWWNWAPCTIIYFFLFFFLSAFVLVAASLSSLTKKILGTKI